MAPLTPRRAACTQTMRPCSRSLSRRSRRRYSSALAAEPARRDRDTAQRILVVARGDSSIRVTRKPFRPWEKAGARFPGRERWMWARWRPREWRCHARQARHAGGSSPQGARCASETDGDSVASEHVLGGAGEQEAGAPSQAAAASREGRDPRGVIRRHENPETWLTWH